MGFWNEGLELGTGMRQCELEYGMRLVKKLNHCTTHLHENGMGSWNEGKDLGMMVWEWAWV